ncbi:MAG: PilZ domain-containing protein [Pyrinomonadaceae bacterium]
MMSTETVVLDEVQDSEANSLHTAVNGFDADGEAWEEVADVFNYTSSGLGLYIPRECAVGNLISLTLPLPPHLRCYDHDEEFYQVWALIQNCNVSTNGGSHAYQAGVAFIGKVAPESYDEDPHQNYRICGMTEDGLWKVTESSSKFIQRKELRYWHKVEIYLAMIDSRRETIGGERAKTENISKKGAALITNLNLHSGDRVKLISEEFDFSSLAVVCNATVTESGKSRVHLEFVGGLFPVDKLQVSRRK